MDELTYKRYEKQFMEWVNEHDLTAEELAMMSPSMIAVSMTDEENEELAAVVEDVLYG